MSQNLFNPPKRVDVDLSPYADQNAYAIGGAWEVEARRQGWSKEDIQQVHIEAQTDDYDHLLDVYFEHSNDGDDSDEDDGCSGDCDGCYDCE